MFGFPQTDLAILTGCPRERSPVWVLPAPLYFLLLQAFQPQTWGPLFSAVAAPSLLCSDREAPPASAQSFPILGPFFPHAARKDPHHGPHSSRLFLHGLVLQFSQLSLLPLFFQLWIRYVSPFPLKALPTPALWGPVTLVGLMIQSGTTETKQASSSALLKLAIPFQLLRGFEERTYAEGPAQCQA